MNRRERRAFFRSIGQKPMTKAEMEKELELMEMAKEIITDVKEHPLIVNEGDKVKIDVAKIKARKEYERLGEGYREFIEANEDTVFTARIQKDGLYVKLKEAPKYLFIGSDLIVVETAQEN